eukprot:TRINITY_DN2783_c0_g2_i1.p1 TRINITY_DN2783_c0_g2~~TRINITY_DN2783_c0_g2_i1.p1  ORF type:complete len:396 (-),score=104.73 TRINITY_DN2783_c0_g2_i1:83-1270(-)
MCIRDRYQRRVHGDAQMRKNKEYEYVIKAQSEKCTRIIEALRVNTESEIIELTGKLEQANKECKHLKLQLGRTSEAMTTAASSKRESNSSELEETMQQLTQRNSELEMELSKRHKNVFDLENLYTQLKAEAVAQREINEKLKADYTALIKKEHELETDNQQLAVKIHRDEQFIQKLTQENERLVQELTSAHIQIEELRKENLNLKTVSVDNNKGNIEAAATELASKSEGSSRKVQGTVKKVSSPIEEPKFASPVQQFNKESEKGSRPESRPEMKYESKGDRKSTGDFLKWDDASANKPVNKQQENTQPPSDILASMPSNKKYMDNKVEIVILQNNLQFFLLEKQRLDKEYSSVTSKADKSVAQRKKKAELENDIDSIEKDIQRTKLKLREYNAFN